MKANEGVLMSNVLNHRMGCGDEVNRSHDGCESGLMRRQMWHDRS